MKKLMMVGAVLLGMSGCVIAQQYKLGHYFPPEDFRARTAQQFADFVEADSILKVNVFPAESLVKGRDALQATSRGTVDFYSVSVSYLSGSIGLMKIFTLPFPSAAYDDNQLIDFANDPKVVEIFDATLQKSNVKLLGFVNSTGEISLFLRQPLIKFDDIKGQKIRGIGGYLDPALKELGASISFMSAAEQFIQLETGGLDGVVTSDSSYVNLGLSRVAPATLEVSLGRIPYALLMNKRKWDRLNESERAVLKSAVQKTVKWSRVNFGIEADRLRSRVRNEVRSTYMPSDTERKILTTLRDRTIQQFIAENGPVAEELVKIHNYYQ